MDFKLLKLCLAVPLVGAMWSCTPQKVNAGNTCEAPPCGPVTAPENNAVTTTGICQLNLLSNVLDFGLVPPGTAKLLAFEIENIGDGPCDVTGVRFGSSTSGFHLNSTPGIPGVLATGQKANLSVEFMNSAAPTSLPRVVNDSMTFEVAGTTVSGYSVALRAHYGESCLVVPQAGVDFGEINVGCHSLVKEVSIVNVCPDSIFVDAVALQGAFEFAAGWRTAQQFPLELLPGIPFNVPVKFNAQTSGQSQEELSLTYRDAIGNQTQKVILTGSAGAQGVVTERYNLPLTTDVLMVLDNSGSMMDDLQTLRAKTGNIFSAAQALRVDLQVGVTTTDAETSAKGQLAKNAGKSVARSQDATPDVTLARLIDEVGFDGSTIESPLEAAQLALSPSLLSSGNDALVRGNSNLVIFFVTDEEDQSKYDNLNAYRALLRSRYGSNNGNLLSLAGIVGKTQNNPMCFVDIATRLTDVASSFGFATDDLCEPSQWAFYDTLAGVRTGLNLRGAPLLQQGLPVEVKVNGQLLPDSDFEVVLGSPSKDTRLQLKQGTFKPGDMVTVTYTPECNPN